MSIPLERLRSRRHLVLAAFDGFVWYCAFAGFLVLSPEAIADVGWKVALVLAAGAAGLQLVLASVVGLHHGRATTGTLEEMMLLGLVTATVGAIITVVNLVVGLGVSAAVPIAATFTSLVLMAWGRATYRMLQEPVARRREEGWPQTPVVIIGAGEGGRQLISSMLRDESSRWLPVALLDDDPLKAHLRIRGVPLLGPTSRLAEVADLVDASTAVVAIPSLPAERVRQLNEAAVEAGLELKVVPATNELLGTRVEVSDIRDLDVRDLLGRRQVETDLSSVADYLTGRRVLVTGAGGSIGSELCQQVAKFGPSELIMLDRDESALHAVQLSIYGRAMLDSDDVVLGDIRDTQFLTTLFEQRRPEVVFHAAALKHLPMLEQYPGEAVKSNVWGTLAVLEAAKHSGVTKFVNISTDKAANPTSVLGYSKRLAEALTATVAKETEGTYLSVRFGNVLGSRGSVLKSFHAQIAAGGPVTVTHPDVTRYFMTVQEAVQLVIQAAAIGSDGEALVLDMGAPVSIGSVARQLIEMSEKQIDIVYTGLREGEKLHEELLADGEPDVRPAHPLVSHVEVPTLDPLRARGIDPWAAPDEVVAVLADICRDLAPTPASRLRSSPAAAS
jgi:FlaA1/EpsC-like NDP-sugar epimerase